MNDILRPAMGDYSCPDEWLDRIAEGLSSPGFLHLKNALHPDFLEKLVGLLEAKEDADKLERAGVGKGASLEVRSEIRSDSIFWLEPEDSSAVTKEWLGFMNEIISFLRRALFLPLESYEGHLARYPEGGFYKPHLDQHRISPTRQVTLITYLNKDWDESNGGQLRLYTDIEKGIHGPYIDILPEYGSVVIFRSADFWHEVLPAKQPRLSLTGWFRGREDNPVLV
ncbi:hypothetical protein Rhal01_00486 [Rubritalea halochordaticola]|uniref:Fe2OG dioxygenase domain-containing protein n=1 Tax=Rubritalea halochordaticola TaxID=714537 RepID=A0ABP9UV22_9BACT